MTDFYTRLGIERTATAAEIKTAYRQLAMQFHPDRNKADTAEDKFKSISEAYDTLGNEAKRAQYDKKFGNPFTHRSYTHNTADYETYKYNRFDEDYFDYGRSSHKTAMLQKVDITLKEAYTGTIAKTGFPVSFVKILAGTQSGKRIILGNGNIAEINVLLDNKFKRSGNDLLVTVDITVSEAIIGIGATLTHIDDTQLKFSIPAGIQPGQSIRLTGKGMYDAESRQRGDLFVQCNLILPTNLTEEQLEFFKSLNLRQSINF